MNHTTFKKIMALNDLKTTSIKVGQKLKLPAPKAAATHGTPAAGSDRAVATAHRSTTTRGGAAHDVVELTETIWAPGLLTWRPFPFAMR